MGPTRYHLEETDGVTVLCAATPVRSDYDLLALLTFAGEADRRRLVEEFHQIEADRLDAVRPDEPGPELTERMKGNR